MKKDIADQWVAALRSGNYKQGHLRLKDDEGNMCCLGVLCDLSSVGSWQPDPYDHLPVYTTPTDGSRGNLPSSVQQWAGMDSPAGDLDKAGSLASLNDDGLTFDQIADLIEKHYQDL